MKDSGKEKEHLIAEVEMSEDCLDSWSKRLNETEVKFRFLYDSHPFVNFIIDAAGNIVEVNRIVTATLGFSGSELLGKPFLNFVVPEDREKTSISLEQDFRGEDNPAIEVGMCGKDGVIHCILFSARQARLIDEDGINRVLITGIDISERKQTEDVLRESEAELFSILSSMVDLVFVLDKERRLKSFYAPSGELYMSPEQFVGKRYSDVMPSHVSKLIDDAFSKNENRDVAEFEYYLEIGGETKWYSAKLSPMIMDDDFSGCVAVIRNITERKKVEAEKREFERELQVVSRLASIGEMASGIAHEVNNPLAGVVGFSELLLGKDLPEDLRKYVEIIHDSAKRVAGIVKRLLAFARQHKPVRSRTDINEIIENTLILRKY